MEADKPGMLKIQPSPAICTQHGGNTGCSASNHGSPYHQYLSISQLLSYVCWNEGLICHNACYTSEAEQCWKFQEFIMCFISVAEMLHFCFQLSGRELMGRNGQCTPILTGNSILDCRRFFFVTVPFSCVFIVETLPIILSCLKSFLHVYQTAVKGSGTKAAKSWQFCIVKTHWQCSKTL